MGLALYAQGALAQAQSVVDPRTTDIALKQGQEDQLKTFNSAPRSITTYILGPGDGLQINCLTCPNLADNLSARRQHLPPRLRALYVEGLTIQELRLFLTGGIQPYVRAPQVYVAP